MQHQIKNKLKTNATAQAMAASHGPYHTSPPPNRHLTAKPAATALWDRRVSEAGRVSWEIESRQLNKFTKELHKQVTFPARQLPYSSCQSGLQQQSPDSLLMKTYSEQLKVDLTGSGALICQSHDISDHQQQRVEICAQLTAQYKSGWSRTR